MEEYPKYLLRAVSSESTVTVYQADVTALAHGSTRTYALGVEGCGRAAAA